MTTRIQRLLLSHDERQSFLIVAIVAVIWWIAYNSLQPIADFITFQLLKLAPESQIGSSLNFFFYDVPKILLLLSGMIFVITTLRSFITPEQSRRWLGGRREGVGNTLAALVGVITPFCSCSAVPLFIGFVESGVPAWRDPLIPRRSADGQ